MTTLVLKRHGGGSYYFSNPNTDSENELFETKIDGADILLDYIQNKTISYCNALNLLELIIKERKLPLAKIKKNK